MNEVRNITERLGASRKIINLDPYVILNKWLYILKIKVGNFC
tara:strand:+ start:1304 stop:1429 length:126 start_codon:yes stop_codon:yes gene_type:complete